MNPLESEFTSCDRFEESISAQVDGELDDQEQVDLENHLQTCESCRQLAGQFARIDGLVFTTATSQTPVERPRVETSAGSGIANVNDTDNRKQAGGRRRIKRWIAIAAATAALVGVFTYGTWTPTDDSGTQLRAERIAGPIAELRSVHQRRAEYNESMLSLLALELRSLKLELKLLEESFLTSSAGESDSSDDQQSRIVAAQRLSAKVRMLETYIHGCMEDGNGNS